MLFTLTLDYPNREAVFSNIISSNLYQRKEYIAILRLGSSLKVKLLKVKLLPNFNIAMYLNSKKKELVWEWVVIQAADFIWDGAASLHLKSRPQTRIQSGKVLPLNNGRLTHTKLFTLFLTVLGRKEACFCKGECRKTCDSILVITIAMKELLFPLLCSFRDPSGGTAEKVMSDWSTERDLKGPAVSKPSWRKPPKTWQIFITVLTRNSKASVIVTEKVLYMGSLNKNLKN